MTKHLGLTVLRIVLGLVIAWYSIALVAAQFRGHPHHALMLLGVVEAIGAILLLIPAAVRIGSITLIVVFACAGLFHALHGDYFNIGSLAIYGAAAFALVTSQR